MYILIRNQKTFCDSIPKDLKSKKHFATAFLKTWKVKNILRQYFQRLGKQKTFCDSVSKNLENKKHLCGNKK